MLEEEKHAASRNRKPYARIIDYNLYSADFGSTSNLLSNAVDSIKAQPNPHHLISACNGSGVMLNMEKESLGSCGIIPLTTLQPKPATGDLFAAAAFVQVAVGAALYGKPRFKGVVLANCMGYGSEQGIFLLEAA